MTDQPETAGVRPASNLLPHTVGIILASGLPGEPRPPRSAMDAVLGARMRPSRARPSEFSAGYSAALSWSLLHSGRAAEAADIADREGMLALHRVAGVASPITQSACYSMLAMTYLLNGKLRASVACSRFARDYAIESTDDRCLFRALGVLSAALAMSGEINSAAEYADEAIQLGGPRGWTAQYQAGPLLLGSVLIRARRADEAGMERDCDVLARAGDDDIICRCVARYCKLILQSVRRNNRQVIAISRLMTQGSDAPLCPPYLRDLALAMESMGHVSLGEPGAALTTLNGRVSPSEHAVCFELLRATAYLQLGEYRKVIRSSEACVSSERDHNIGTLVSVLLRRALAHEALGLHAAADSEYSNANHLAYESGLLSATLGMPVPGLRALFDRMTANEPEFAAQVADHLPRDYEYPDPAGLSFEPVRLTERETVVAEWLLTDLALPVIAAELGVSINTVKSQVSSLYRKLGVSSRADAAVELRRSGVCQPQKRIKRQKDS